MLMSIKSFISSLIIGSMILLNTGCGTPTTNNSDSETKWLPVVFYALVVVSTGLTINSMIRTDAQCRAELAEYKRRNPNSKLRCEQRSFRG